MDQALSNYYENELMKWKTMEWKNLGNQICMQSLSIDLTNVELQLMKNPYGQDFKGKHLRTLQEKSLLEQEVYWAQI